jgi:hypothetical protein
MGVKRRPEKSSAGDKESEVASVIRKRVLKNTSPCRGPLSIDNGAMSFIALP